MSPDRGPVTRCRIKGCAFVGFFSGYDLLCPEHRNDDTARHPRPPTLAEAWKVQP